MCAYVSVYVCVSVCGAVYIVSVTTKTVVGNSGLCVGVRPNRIRISYSVERCGKCVNDRFGK